MLDESMFHTAELNLIHLIQQFRSPALDAFFKFFDYFDRSEFFFVLIPAIWLGTNWKIGYRLFCILFLSNLTNHILKAFFALPRPFHLDPSVGVIQVHGYGFPSGAAQTVILLSGLLLYYWDNSWKWIICPAYILLVSFSRVYLGLHFPTDILGGWVVGLALWAIFIYVRPPLEKQLQKWNPPALFATSQAIPLFLLFCTDSPSLSRSCASAMGMGIGLSINHVRRWSLAAPKTQTERAVRVAIGIIGTFLCYVLLSLLPLSPLPLATFCKFLILGLWIATGSLLLCRKLFLSQKEPNA